jgi:hypothetical protein
VLVLTVQAYDPDSTDTLEFVWRVNGVVDPIAQDSTYTYARGSAALDTVEVEISDGAISTFASWEIRVAATGIEVVSTFSSDDSLILHSFPNPTRGRTNIAFTLPREVHVSLRLYDVRGSLLRTLVTEPRVPGRHEVIWDGRDDKDRPVAAGVYFVRLRSEQHERLSKLTMVR